MSYFRAPQVVAGLTAIAGLWVASYWSVRLGWAGNLFRRDTIDALAPGSAAYPQRLAVMRASEGLAARPDLERALRANPWMSRAWVALGLEAERDGNLRQAEAHLRRAAAFDHTYATLWTLTNFYFRQDEARQFWPVARQALRIGNPVPHSPVPLFELCWKMSQDSRMILERAIPDTGAVLARYLDFLIAGDQMSAAEPVAQRVISLASDSDLASVLRYCDRLLEFGDVDRALRAWNALCVHRFGGYQFLAPSLGVSLTNGSFAVPLLAHGFDWRALPVEGVAISRDGGGVHIGFDRRQPDTCEPLVQFLPLVPLRKYALRFRYRADGIPPGSGLRWRLFDVAHGREIASAELNLASDETTSSTFRFQPAGRLGRLSLAYERPSGATRIDGVLTLRGVELAFEP